MSERKPVRTVVRLTTGRENFCEDWELAWNETLWLKGRIGLLYGLPKERDNKLWPWSISKLLWCFDSSQTEWEFEGGNSEDVYEAKKFIARTAFSILNRTLFARSGSIYERREYWINLFSENIELVESFVYFFRSSSRGLENFPIGLLEDDSIPHDAKEFVISLCRFIWTHQGKSGWGDDRPTLDRLNKLRPQTIEILCSLRAALWFFMNRDWVDSYNEEVLEKLEEIALRAKVRLAYNKEERSVTSVEEAVYANSHAAQTLIVLRTRKLVQDKFDEINRLEQTTEDARRKLQELKKS